MTLRTKPVGTVSVTKKPDGRLVLHYARPDGTAVFAPSQVREEESSTTTSTEGCTTFARCVARDQGCRTGWAAKSNRIKATHRAPIEALQNGKAA